MPNLNNNNNRGNNRPQIIAPDAITVTSFYDSEGNPKKDLFSTFAENVAKTFSFKQDKVKVGVTRTQLRRFFDEVKRYDLILDSENDKDWKNQEPYIRMIKSKIAYTVARVKGNDEKKFYRNLSLFLSSCIDSVKSAKDYHVFSTLFESVYGYYYELAPKD